MRRDLVYRGWTVLACTTSIASGLGLWGVGECLFGGCGLAAGVFHALWAIDLRARVRGRWQRRPIVIPRLHRSPKRTRRG